jgi:DNA-binding XRE family transcriptional regulator
MVDNAVINERGGAKADAGKTRYDLLVPEFIQGMANVMTFGATKYSDWNWVNLERNRVFASLWRHIIAYQKGERLDKETNLSHLYHAGCNLMMLDRIDDFPISQIEYETNTKTKEETGNNNKLYNTYVCVRGVLRYLTMTSEKLNSDIFSDIDLVSETGKLILADIDFRYWNKYSLDDLRYMFRMSMEYLEHGRQKNKVEYHKGLYRAFQNRMRQIHGQHGMSLNDLAEHVEIDRDTLYKMMQDIYDEHYRFYTAQQYAEKLSFTYQTDNE